MGPGQELSGVSDNLRGVIRVDGEAADRRLRLAYLIPEPSPVGLVVAGIACGLSSQSSRRRSKRRASP